MGGSHASTHPCARTCTRACQCAGVPVGAHAEVPVGTDARRGGGVHARRHNLANGALVHARDRAHTGAQVGKHPRMQARVLGPFRPAAFLGPAGYRTLWYGARSPAYIGLQRRRLRIVRTVCCVLARRLVRARPLPARRFCLCMAGDGAGSLAWLRAALCYCQASHVPGACVGECPC